MLENSLDTTIGRLVSGDSLATTTTAVRSDNDAREVARKFEALLLQTMLKSMRAATPSDGLLGSNGGEMYQEMFDQRIAEEISKTGTFGIQENIFRQLTGGHLAQGAVRGVHLTGSEFNPSVHRAVEVNRNSFLSQDNSPTGFVNRLRAAASVAADKIGTSIEAVIAVAALETGWGKRVASTADGNSTHNLFGIKADSRWQGETSQVKTHEFRQGTMQSEIAAFRVYRSEQASIEDFANFLQSNPRYHNALKSADNPEQFVRELQKAGYATDPDYADKVIAIMKNVESVMTATTTGPR